MTLIIIVALIVFIAVILVKEIEKKHEIDDNQNHNKVCLYYYRNIVLEVPHFASLRGKEREIKILRSDNGEKWEEHNVIATDEAVNKALEQSMEGK